MPKGGPYLVCNLDCCDAGIWIEAPTVTAAVNGSISGATALVLDGNVGTIEVGDIVTGDGISWNSYCGRNHGSK